MENRAIRLLRDELQSARHNLAGTMEGVTPEHMHWVPPGTANPLGAVYAHLVLAEDMFISFLQGKPPLSTSTYAGRDGVSEPMPVANWADYGPWTRRVRIDLPELEAFHIAVAAETGHYLASLTDADLDRPVDLSGFGGNKTTVSAVVADRIIAHMNNIMGEISALKGIQGLRGYPF